jgi:hypothetical protein
MLKVDRNFRIGTLGPIWQAQLPKLSDTGASSARPRRCGCSPETAGCWLRTVRSDEVPIRRSRYSSRARGAAAQRLRWPSEPNRFETGRSRRSDAKRFKVSARHALEHAPVRGTAEQYVREHRGAAAFAAKRIRALPRAFHVKTMYRRPR